MKKRYIAPQITREVALRVHAMLCASDGSGVTSNGIGYGGVDTGGTLDPSAREDDFWDEDME